jgi:hypothetical protein
MLIIKNKHWGDWKRLLMLCNSGMCTNGTKWIKTRMKTPICVNSKGNEIITWCLISIWSCFLLNNYHHYMCYYHRCLLHHICVNWVNNDNVHQVLEVVYGDKDIHSSSGVAKEKVKNPFLNMCCTFQNNNYDNILKCVVGCYTFIFARHWNKWVLMSSMVWPHWHHEKWAIVGYDKPRWVHNVIRKWVEDKWNVGVVGWINN